MKVSEKWKDETNLVFIQIANALTAAIRVPPLSTSHALDQHLLPLIPYEDWTARADSADRSFVSGSEVSTSEASTEVRREQLGNIIGNGYPPILFPVSFRTSNNTSINQEHPVNTLYLKLKMVARRQGAA